MENLMRNNQSLFILILLILCGCSSKTASRKVFETRETESDFQLNIYEVLRHSDTSYIQILDRIPAIEGFTKITELDYQNYPDNLAGVTNDQKHKPTILDQVNFVLDENLNLKPVWSKFRIDNMGTNENNYELY